MSQPISNNSSIEYSTAHDFSDKKELDLLTPGVATFSGFTVDKVPPVLLGSGFMPDNEQPDPHGLSSLEQFKPKDTEALPSCSYTPLGIESIMNPDEAYSSSLFFNKIDGIDEIEDPEVTAQNPLENFGTTPLQTSKTIEKYSLSSLFPVKGEQLHPENMDQAVQEDEKTCLQRSDNSNVPNVETSVLPEDTCFFSDNTRDAFYSGPSTEVAVHTEVVAKKKRLIVKDLSDEGQLEKAEQRKQNNRKSAKRSRDSKKILFKQQKESYDQIKIKNNELKKQLNYYCPDTAQLTIAGIEKRYPLINPKKEIRQKQKGRISGLTPDQLKKRKMEQNKIIAQKMRDAQKLYQTGLQEDTVNLGNQNSELVIAIDEAKITLPCKNYPVGETPLKKSDPS